MKNKQAQQTMIDALDIMICHADKGASGFWIDDGEGCGNPAIFPEFEDGLKHGRLVQKEHYLCPWNTAVMKKMKRFSPEPVLYLRMILDIIRVRQPEKSILQMYGSLLRKLPPENRTAAKSI